MVQDFGGVVYNKLAINRSGVQVIVDENTLGGGEIPGLLRFQNTNLVEGCNLLGRLTMAYHKEMNTQQTLGLDLDGNVGSNIFSPTTFNTQNALNHRTSTAKHGYRRSDPFDQRRQQICGI